MHHVNPDTAPAGPPVPRPVLALARRRAVLRTSWVLFAGRAPQQRPPRSCFSSTGSAACPGGSVRSCLRLSCCFCICRRTMASQQQYNPLSTSSCPRTICTVMMLRSDPASALFCRQITWIAPLRPLLCHMTSAYRLFQMHSASSCNGLSADFRLIGAAVSPNTES